MRAAGSPPCAPCSGTPAAAGHELPVAALTRRAAADPFPARVVEGAAPGRFVAGSAPITDAHPGSAAVPPPGVVA
ncbi:MAG TPA: hypothetical protein VMU94_02620 [Streptosporangiaceae bacterium]|nr:hypothetical protein [Streptosporangiaceae bacterium]